MSVLISRRKQRPSSASAALQTHFSRQTVTIDDIRPATSIPTSRNLRNNVRNQQTPIGTKTRTQHNNAINGWTSIVPMQTNSRTQRRITLSTVNNVSISTNTRSRPTTAASSKIKQNVDSIYNNE
ncbi:uncharacterized protein TRIADDRAFT_56147 [Trichoplax adhaerens]|uniref:Uncharacterized protein n=1 Tax=Trichoplax adhaerens TaxID=10228 RepID=B3RXB2_TRIAD|nr:predicted protein [Trichoplax adhaerens]EDV24386.1 predicted protein [Trichoplax adhaerens]|eukprot:XP_002112276.1 predicted protein [Trichoplax adhaerens]